MSLYKLMTSSSLCQSYQVIVLEDILKKKTQKLVGFFLFLKSNEVLKVALPVYQNA